MTKSNSSAPAVPLADLISTKPFLTSEEAALFTGYKKATLSCLRCQGKGPPYSKPNGGRVVYPVDALTKWLRASRKGAA